MFDVQMAEYRSVHGTFNVVTLCGGLPIHYKGNRYDVYVKVCFSPGFPNEYPIVSVMNIDPGRFKIADIYAVNGLPDGTFEVPLQSVKNWQYTMQFAPILEEVQRTLGQNFPFFKNNGQQPHYNIPRTYEERALLKGQGHQQQHNFQQQQNFHGGPQPVFQQTPVNPGFGNQLDGNTEKQAKNDLEVLADSLKMDVGSVTDNLKIMLQKDQEIKMRSDMLNSQKGDVSKMKTLVEQDISTLTSYYDQNNSKTLDEKVINDIWHPNSDHGKQSIEVLATLLSLKEGQEYFYKMYEEDFLKIDYEDAKKVIEKFAREEFAAKSKLRELV